MLSAAEKGNGQLHLIHDWKLSNVDPIYRKCGKYPATGSMLPCPANLGKVWEIYHGVSGSVWLGMYVFWAARGQHTLCAGRGQLI